MKRIVILSSARSGTNLVRNLINQCLDNPLVLGEIFRESGDSIDTLCSLLKVNYSELDDLKKKGSAGFWETICKKAESSGVENIVVKIFYEHLDKDDQLLELLNRDHVILHVIRLNQFNCYLSLQLAFNSDVWIVETSNKNEQLSHQQPINISRSKLEDHLLCASREIKFFRKLLIGNSYHEFYYEDFARDYEKFVSSLGNILPVKIVKGLDPGIKKQKQRSNSELVSNYEEVKDLDRVDLGLCKSPDQ